MRLILIFIRTAFFFFTVLFILGSCVSNRKVQLMQKDDVNADISPKDSVLRTYSLDTFSYKLQPNDVIFLQVRALLDKEFDIFNQATGQNANFAVQAGAGQLFGELIDENGEINLPVVGKVKVAGLTIFEAQDRLQEIAGQYIDSPVVKVRLMNYRITVLGEVKSEGTVVLANNRVSMLEAIAQAGGFGDLADRSDVKLIRQKGGTTEVVYLNLLTEDFFNSPYYYVYQNDVLVVPPLKQRPFRNYFGQNLALVVSSLSLILLTITLIQQN
jgi:polysaccharide export outer membrane protein